VSLLVLLAALPALYWPEPVATAPALRDAGIERILVPAEQLEAWTKAGFSAVAMSAAELEAREKLPTPGLQGQVALASATRTPYVVANGWRFARKTGGKYVYDAPAGRAVLAAAEAFAYGVDAVLKIQPVDLCDLGGLLAFLSGVPAPELPAVADIAVVDDGSPVVGEVMNLLARRNLLFRPAPPKPPAKGVLIVDLASKEFPRQDAADPSAFAQKVRRVLGDERRSLRLYGSEVVIGRLTGDATQVRLDLVNYGGRDVVGLRVRVRGLYAATEAFVAGQGRVPVEEPMVTDEATELTVARMGVSAVVLLPAPK
jgi:hypothetical protein